MVVLLPTRAVPGRCRCAGMVAKVAVVRKWLVWMVERTRVEMNASLRGSSRHQRNCWDTSLTQ